MGSAAETSEIEAILNGQSPTTPTQAPLPTINQAQYIPNLGGENPGEFALGAGPGMMAPPPGGGFQPNPKVLSQAGAAATPFGFGTPNPYASYFQNGPGGGNGQQGNTNANIMAALMSQEPVQPQLPPNVGTPPVNIPPITFTG